MTGGFPEDLRGRRLVAQEYLKDGEFKPAIENLFAVPEIDYLQVHSTAAGCFTFRIERAAQSRDLPVNPSFAIPANYSDQAR